MPSLDDRALWKALGARALARAYCLYGDEEYLKGQALRQLIATALDPATRDFNLDVRDGSELDAGTLASLLATPPMMSEHRLVVVRQAGLLRKDARTVVDRFLDAPADRPVDVILALVLSAGEKGKPDRTLMERTVAVELAPLDGSRLAKWITHQAVTTGVTISPGAVELLQSAVGTDLATLAGEIEKLASYTNGGPIDESAVTAVVGVRRGETVSDLLDRVAARDAQGALDILSHVLAQPKTSGVSIVMALTTQTLALAWGQAMRARGVPVPRLKREYFDFLKSAGGAYTARPWGEAIDAWCRELGRWDAAALDRACEALLAADAALKGTSIESEEQLLATLVLELCAADADVRISSAVA